MSKFWSISRNTFVEAIRQPIYGILIAITFGVLVLSLPLSTWTMGDEGSDFHGTDQKMLSSLGLATLLVAGLLVAAFSASAALSREIEDKTALTVISKPVSRATFVLGKFAGVAASTAVAFYLCALVFLMTVRHQVMSTGSDTYDMPVIVIGTGSLALALVAAVAGNYLFSWPFVSAAVRCSAVMLTAGMGLIGFVGKEWKIVPFGAEIDPQIFPAMALIFLAVLILVSVAIAAGTRLGQLATLLVCVGFFFVGTAHPYLFAQWAQKAPIARALSWIAPNLTFFYPLDALVLDKPLPTSYVLLTCAYGACYMAAVLAVGVCLFQRRQLEAQGSSTTVPGGVALLAFGGRAASLCAAVAALVLLSGPAFHSARGVLMGAGILMAAAAGYLLFSCFGRGARWSWWLLVLLCPAVGGGCLVILFAPALSQLKTQMGPVRTAVAAVISAVALALLVLPKTRHHFHSRPSTSATG